MSKPVATLPDPAEGTDEPPADRRAWIVPGIFAACAAWVLWAAATYGDTDVSDGAVVTTAGPNEAGDPSALVDGDAETEAIHTAGSSGVVVDLGSPREIDEIVLHRRESKGRITLEISLDGEYFAVFGTKRGAFDQFSVENTARARYVRITGGDKGPLRLTELDVLGF
jgi:hypothetical protein